MALQWLDNFFCFEIALSILVLLQLAAGSFDVHRDRVGPGYGQIFTKNLIRVPV